MTTFVFSGYRMFSGDTGLSGLVPMEIRLSLSDDADTVTVVNEDGQTRPQAEGFTMSSDEGIGPINLVYSVQTFEWGDGLRMTALVAEWENGPFGWEIAFIPLSPRQTPDLSDPALAAAFMETVTNDRSVTGLWGPGREFAVADIPNRLGTTEDDFIVLPRNFQSLGEHVLTGGEGDDFIAAAGQSTIHGDQGDDTLSAGFLGTGLIYGGIGRDQVSGEGTLYGGAGDDYIDGPGRIFAGGGNDRISTGGDAVVTGGAGADTIYLDSFLTGVGAVVLTDFDPRAGDVLYLARSLAGGARSAEDAIAALAERTDEGTLLRFSATESLLLRGVFNTDLLAQATVLVASQSWMAPTYYTDGDDTIFGYELPDLLYAFGGNDQIGSRAGDDTIRAGTGDDLVNGGEDADLIHGEGGNDELQGDVGRDSIFGGNGDDTISSWRLEGFGDEAIWSSGGGDLLHGGAGNDRITDGDGSSQIFGDGGDDLLSGGAGLDTLYGGDGMDRLLGNEGRDQLYGGRGHDRFSKGIDGSVDTIHDFQDGIDVFDFSHIGFDSLTITDAPGGLVRVAYGDDVLLITNRAGTLTAADITQADMWNALWP